MQNGETKEFVVLAVLPTLEPRWRGYVGQVLESINEQNVEEVADVKRIRKVMISI